jgi:hypothetical protein
MKRRRDRELFKFMAMAVVALRFNAANAAFETGNRLLGYCTTSAPGPAEMVCLGYVEGVADDMEAKRMICLPAHVTTGQLEDIVVRYLREHPESRHLVASELIAGALLETFPCSAR